MHLAFFGEVGVDGGGEEDVGGDGVGGEGEEGGLDDGGEGSDGEDGVRVGGG